MLTWPPDLAVKFLAHTTVSRFSLTRFLRRRRKSLQRRLFAWSPFGSVSLFYITFISTPLTDTIGVNDATLPPNEAALPIEQFIENMHQLLSDLTSFESPYAIADTPLSIILITPGPVFSDMFEPGSGKADHWCQAEPTKLFRNAVLKIGEEWKERETREKEAKGPLAKMCAIEAIDFWGDVVSAAGGERECLRPFLRSVYHSFLWKTRS
jgi:hypothetical protein